ncbi:hypothetical protein H310_06394 [Aphanomyces invadans]|uniref:Ubiquitin-like domain-containing protein n=1 Tax=Aphanomyces invadans TaxID=157072 RepID=A0A024U6B6_9STRA|nr:hypothetical protein H310_06394 [Aphanomyces invadans]ETW01819.1 hypothetical protein H310_06394 [Aphanomyces invadans]|eukprot:XP_008869667.1 hypothetical protein H310_06394 [Aphanomyces invadans]
MESTTGDSTVQSSPSMREASTSSDAATSGVVQMAIDVTQVAPAGNASSVIALNVKTVDQRQFQINLLASSSVPQLKTKIEHETGVVTDRQRLIFRGKVLKNENNLAHYALENGHTLHLVIRPADASPMAASNTPSTITPPPQGNQGNAWAVSANPSSSPTPNVPRSHEPRSNDDPDPTLVNPDVSNNIGAPRVMATFEVPEGAHSVPLLQSILSTIMNSVQGLANNEGAQPTAQTTAAASTTLSSPQGASPSSSIATPRSVQVDSLLSDPPVRNSTMERVLQRVQSNSSRQGRNARVDALLTSLTRLLSRPDSAFPSTIHDVTHPTYEEGIQAFRTQVETLVSLMTQLQPRFDRLPVALQELHHRNGNRPSQIELVNPIFRTIEGLQSMGEVAVLLARICRRLLLRHNSSSTASPSVDSSPTTTNWARPPSEAPPSTALSSSGAHSSSPPSAQGNLGDFLEQQLRRSDSFSTLLAEMRQFGNVTTSPSTSGDGNGIEFEATIPILIYPTQQGALPSQPPTGRRWDFESFGQHVVQTLSAVDLFGVLAGSRDALLRFVQHVGVQMIDGNALPSMAPGTNRDWSNQMMSAFRDYVDSLPRFNHPMVPPSTNLMARIVQSMSPFAAELVVFFIRGTNVEPANAASFLDSFCTFVGHMTRQVVADMLALLSVPSALERVLEDLLTHLGVAVTTARFVVQAFVTVPGVQTAMASIPSQQHASARRPTPDPEGDGPALKRSRQE